MVIQIKTLENFVFLVYFPFRRTGFYYVWWIFIYYFLCWIYIRFVLNPIRLSTSCGREGGGGTFCPPWILFIYLIISAPLTSLLLVFLFSLILGFLVTELVKPITSLLALSWGGVICTPRGWAFSLPLCFPLKTSLLNHSLTWGRGGFAPNLPFHLRPCLP